MEYFEQKKNAISVWLKNSPKSYIIYVLSTIILFTPSLVIFISFPEYFHKYVTIVAYIFIPAILIAFLMDAKWLVIEVAKTKIGKIIYSIMAYFAYTKAEIMSKWMIYDITTADPDQYASATKTLIGMYFIPAWLMIITNILVILVFVVAILSLVLMPKKETYRKALQYILLKLGFNWSFHQGIGGHILFFYLGLVFFMALFAPLTQKALTYIPQKNIATTTIFESSYYPNKTCKLIPYGTFIKLLGDNQVSVANMHTFEIYKLFFNDYQFNFRTEKCN